MIISILRMAQGRRGQDEAFDPFRWLMMTLFTHLDWVLDPEEAFRMTVEYVN